MFKSCNGLLLLGLGFCPLAVSAGPGSVETFEFRLDRDESCTSFYSVDDLATRVVEKACAEFDLSGYQASAFQGGIGIGAVGLYGEIRPFWGLGNIVFNLEPRPLPNPAVSPLIFFSFQKDEVCPSGYAGSILEALVAEQACLAFSLDGYDGVAVKKVLKEGEEPVWALAEIEFDVKGSDLN